MARSVVEVVVTGVVGRNPDGTAELCPYEDLCFGVRIGDNVDAAFDGAWIEAVGTFDGHTLHTTEPLRKTDPPPLMARASLEPRCPDLAAAFPPSPDATDAARQYLDTVPDEFAGVWLDDTGVLTYFFVGEDVDAHRVALSEAVGDAPVCVTGGARWPLAELREVSDRIFATSRSVSGGVDEVDNVVDVHVRLLDGDGRRWLEQFGDQVRLSSYIELVNASRADFPAMAPIAPGDVPLVTQRDGGRNGEEAGVGFTLRYDEQRSCVFGEAEAVEGGTRRVLPGWPDGYSATSNPLTIRDFDGMTVAVEGQAYEGGGGYHDPATIGRWSDQSDTCGVDGAGAMVVITR